MIPACVGGVDVTMMLTSMIFTRTSGIIMIPQNFTPTIIRCHEKDGNFCK